MFFFKHPTSTLVITFWITLFAVLSPSYAQTPPQKVPIQFQEVFFMPALGGQLQPVIAALASKRFSEAEKRLKKIIAAFPWHGQSHYLLASLMAIQGRTDEAIESLKVAIDNGFSNQSALYKDPNLVRIREDKRFAVLAEKLIAKLASDHTKKRTPIAPHAVVNGNAVVSTQNTAWDQRFGVLKSFFKFNSRKVAPATVRNGEDPATKKLNELFRRGLAAGNNGDLYDNRDRHHSNLSIKEFPQLSFTQYGDLAKLQDTDYGLNSRILFNAPTIGNSSTAVNSGVFWRSQARLGYTIPGGVQKYFLQYMSNHLYVYPAVQDFTAKSGDNMPANSPYILVTEGKSGSDRPFLKAIVSILAALKPEVKDTLAKTKRLMPAVQMIFRKGQKGVHTREVYLSSKAHPVVFSGGNINLIKMITLANNLKAEDVPPVVFLNVTEESGPEKGVDNFAAKIPESLFNTPASIARAIRNTSYEKRIVVSTRNTQYPGSKPLSYKWVLLQGDPKKVKITPKNTEGSLAEIRIGWHGKLDFPGRPDIETNRVEIGVFADNGKELSAPSFINILYPRNQTRIYDSANRLLSLSHRASKGVYVDPQIFPKRDWQDDYKYDAKGNLTGWIRTRHSGKTEFSRHGAIIVEKDAKGRPIKAEKIEYQYGRDQHGRLTVTEKPLKDFLQYHYLDDADSQGIIAQ